MDVYTGLSSFERRLGRKMKPAERIQEREWYINRILSHGELTQRETLKKKQDKQLKLFT